MNIKKFRWSKALALLLALTMVMMYSFSFATAVYAKDNQKVEIHFDNFVLDESIDGVQVRIVAGGETYDSTSSKIDKNRKKAEAFYSKDSLPDTSTSVSSVIVTLMIDDDPQASFTNLKKDSNIGTGGGTYSIWIDAEKNPPTGSTLTIEKLIDSDLIDGDEVFNFNVTGPEGYDEDVSAGASDGVLTGLLLGDYIITEYYNDTNYLETDSQEMSITTLDWTDSVTFNNIPIESPPDYGSITITETEASVYLPTTPQTITLTENNLNQTVNFINSPENGSTPDLGSITIHKTISGAAFGNSEEFEFTVVGEDFNEVVTAGSTDGYLGELELGEYTITETEASGYLPTTPQTITLAENNLNQTVNFNNESLINDLGVTKTANPSSMLLGASTYFVIIITNHGTMTAYNIDVKDTWPVGVSLSSVIADEGTTYEGATWSIGSLEPGDSKTLTLSAVTIATGTIENVVGIMGNGDDNPDNNTDSAIITVSTQTPTPGPTPTHHRTTPPTVIEEPVIPLAEEPVIPLAEEPVIPLAEEPVVTPIITEELTIPEEPTPLADVVPQTGDANNILLILGLMFASGTGIAVLGRRKENAGK